MSMRALVVTTLLLLATPSEVLAFDDGGFTPGAMFDASSVAVLLDSSVSLADLDATTGMFLGDITAIGEQHAAVSQLFDSSALAFDAELMNEAARAEADNRRRIEEQRLVAEARARAARAQTEISPDGCPTAVPPRTLRDGSDDVGAYELCVASVATAATPEAAEAVKYVFQNLGIPYSRTDRMGANAFDCSSFVMRAYDAAGVDVLSKNWAPTTHTLAPYPGYSSYPWLETVDYDEAQPGDLLLRPQSRSRSDGGGHVAMLLADGFMAHTAAVGDVSHIAEAYEEDELFNVRRVSP